LELVPSSVRAADVVVDKLFAPTVGEAVASEVEAVVVDISQLKRRKKEKTGECGW